MYRDYTRPLIQGGLKSKIDNLFSFHIKRILVFGNDGCKYYMNQLHVFIALIKFIYPNQYKKPFFFL
jgi:hypothetical protein